MKLSKYIIMLGLGACTLGLTTACSDRADEITELSYSRLFSALGLEARVMNQINVRLDWKEVKGASTYNIYVYEATNQEGEDEDATDNTKFVTVPEGAKAVRTIEGLAYDKLPYTVSSLVGQTRYIFEVVAVDADGGKSKGICVQAKTGAEQTFKTVADDELEAKAVTLRWNAVDAEGCIIKIQAAGAEDYVVQHTITAEEGAAKCVRLEGLTGETTYTAYMKTQAGKTRGTMEFTTAVDLGDAISVTSDQNLNDVIAEAPAGSTLALWPGTYECTSEDGSQVKISVDKNLSIKAVRAGDRPVIKGCIHIKSGATLTMSQIVMDGAGSDGSQAFEWKDAGTYDSFNLEDCEIKNYTKGFFYINCAAEISSININNCLIHDIECSGGDLFDCRAGAYHAFNLTNTTVYNSAASRDFIRFDDKSANFSGVTPAIKVDHCTLYKVGNGGANYRLLYTRFAGHTITWTNNIVAEFSNTRGFSNQKTTAVPTFSGNYYYNTVNLLSLADGNTEAITFFDEKGKAVSSNPFKDAEKGNFTLTNEDMNYYGVGDPRWVVK